MTILDSSLIRLAGRGQHWAQTTRHYNTGLKLHIQYTPKINHLDTLCITNPRVNDLTVGQSIAIEKGRIYTFDKGYCDYNWWKKIHDQEAIFVTRLKHNAAFRIQKNRRIHKSDQGVILKDQEITLASRFSQKGKKNELAWAQVPLRLVEIPHPQSAHKKPFWIVTNAVDVSAAQIAAWYKERWAIELLFKWLKQNLKIKKFLGESENAIKIQIFAAMIAYVLVQIFKALYPNAFDRMKDILVVLRTHIYAQLPIGVFQTAPPSS